MRVPIKCPVCEGSGFVKPGFYPDAPKKQHAKCRSCHGTGLVESTVPDPIQPRPVRYPVPVPQPYPVPYTPWKPYQPYWWQVGTTYKAPLTDYTIYSVTADSRDTTVVWNEDGGEYVTLPSGGVRVQ